MKRLSFFVLFLAACAETNAPTSAPTSSPKDAPKGMPATASTPAPRPTGVVSTAPVGPQGVPKPEEIFARLRTDLVTCYEKGKREIPTMTSGKVTLRASVDAQGKTTCVVPSDDTGLTQEVEDCMCERVGREAYAPSASAWSTALPIVVREATLSMGTLSEAPVMEMVESHGLSEEIYDVIERLLPELKACLKTVDKASGLQVVYVGGRVDRDGKVQCALASSSSTVPVEARECAANVLSRARFAPPKRGNGLVSIPLEVFKRM